MNIFILDNDIETCAKYHCDKHVVKMIVEYTQLLSTTCRLNGIDYGYKACYVNHPCRKWVGECFANFAYLYSLAIALCNEYTFRYGKIHKTEEVIKNIPLKQIQDILPYISVLPPPQCMPDDCKIKNDAVSAYRKYYLTNKKDLLSYTKRKIPHWIKEQK
jgi:hypothetical protein